MEIGMHGLGLLCLVVSLSAATSCEARGSWQFKNSLHPQAVKNPSSQETRALKRWVTYSSDPTTSYYMGSPLSLPPYQDVMGPSSSPQDNPPYCVYPPSTTLPSPVIPFQSPPPPPTSTTSPPILTPNPPESFIPSPPSYIPSPPESIPGTPTYLPNPPEFVPTPPEGTVPIPPEGTVPTPPEYEPSPPSYVPSPPEVVPGPPEFVPGPPVFEPPVVFPPPTAQPPPYTGTTPGLWCVAKPTVPDPIIMEAMNYACGSGADCDSVLPSGPCYKPDTLIAHASFAFNSYWQRTKVAGGSCDFGGVAMLITKDPSYDGCNFNI